MVFLGYLLLTAAVTYPALFSLSSAAMGEPQVDVHCHLWDIWWSNRTLAAGAGTWSFSDYIYYPAGISVWRFFAGPLLFLFSTAMHFLLGDLKAAYNATVICSILCSCLGGYVLGREVLRDRAAALLVGVVVAINPVVLNHVKDGLPEFVNLGWAMLFLRSLVIMNRERDLRSAALSLFWYVVATLWCWYIGALLVILAGLFLLVFTSIPRLFSRDRRYLLILLFWAAGVFTMVIVASKTTSVGMVSQRLKQTEAQLVRGMRGYEGELDLGRPHYLYSHARRLGIKDIDSVESFEIKLLTSVDPVSLVTAWKVRARHAELFPLRWLIPLLMALLALVLARERMVVFCGVVILFTGAVALGPCLVVGGEVCWQTCGWTPYSLLGKLVPGLDRIQFPRRMLLVAILPLSLMAGLGLKELSGRLPRLPGPVALALAAALSLCGALSLSGYPLARSRLPVPNFYNQLAKESADFAILDVPFTYGAKVTYHGAGPRYAYYQTVHGKRKHGGAVPLYLATPKHPKDIATNALLRSLRRIADGKDPDSTRAEVVKGAASLGRHRFRYIVIHPSDLTQKAAAAMGKLLASFLSLPRLDNSVTEDRLIIFKL